MTNPTREHLAGLELAKQLLFDSGAADSAQTLDDLIAQAKAAPQDEPVADDLDSRMRDAGMLSVAQLLAGAPLDAFVKHAGVNDLDTFGQWLEMRRAECLKMQARFQLDKREDDELYEWVTAHAAVFTEVHVNFKAVIANPPAPDAELIELLRELRLMTLGVNSGQSGVLRGHIDKKLAQLRTKGE